MVYLRTVNRNTGPWPTITAFTTHLVESMKFFIWNIIVALCFSGQAIPVSVSSASLQNTAVQQQVYVGSTPGDAFIKSRLGIPGDTPIDFIRWKLQLDTASRRSFELQISYGVGQPNTLFFKNGGLSQTFRGAYTVSSDADRLGGAEIFRLQGSPFPNGLAMVCLNDNLVHVLTAEDHLMVGNGGWSYTLNKEMPTASQNLLPNLQSGIRTPDTGIIQSVYEGRTPCSEIAAAYHLDVSTSCFKIKWKLTLSRDGKSFKPTTYALRAVVDNMPLDASGKWAIEEGFDTNAIILTLQPDHSEDTMYLLVSDENISFFLSPDRNLLVGDENFSYTLNRRVASPEPPH